MSQVNYEGPRLEDLKRRDSLDEAVAILAKAVSDGTVDSAVAYLMRKQLEWWFSPRRFVNSRGGSA